MTYTLYDKRCLQFTDSFAIFSDSCIIILQSSQSGKEICKRINEVISDSVHNMKYDNKIDSAIKPLEVTFYAAIKNIIQTCTVHKLMTISVISSRNLFVLLNEALKC